MERVRSSYLALILAGFIGHLVVVGIAIAFPNRLAPWIALQLALMPVAAGVAWFFPGWLSVFSLLRFREPGSFRFGREGDQNLSLDQTAYGMPSREIEMRLRSEIRELTKLRRE